MEEKKSGKGLAIASLVLGILAIINSFIPIINFIAYILGIIALILGIIAIVKNAGRGMAIAGVVLAGVALILATIINAGTASVVNEALDESGLTEATETTNSGKSSKTSKNKKYGLGETFVFDELEITLDSTYSFATINNRFSDLNGRDVIRLGATVKNLSEDTHSLNMFFYDLFGSQGTELETVSAYFDDNIDYAGDLRPGASYHTNFYILYDGNGKYGIDFDNYSQKVDVEFDVQK